ncbi:hypothetical protein Pcinc_003756 [Petrolisthes cinctipes]|uniref:Uncharacterized protein n=1 Tax=Petrolisthes cinctipes TaxID=88211 RepID=A0AAE1L0W2_PETCI|nr:hypothetical protein Pcinc_003756 [Petrolisthes cinctipes]
MHSTTPLSKPCVAPGPLSKLPNSNTPLSKPHVAPGPPSKLRNSTTPLSIPRGPLSSSTSHAPQSYSPHLVLLHRSTLHPMPLRHPRCCQ